MVKFHLSKLLGEKRMTQKELSQKTGIRNSTINEYYNEIAISIKFEHIDKICEVLDCTTDELHVFLENSGIGPKPWNENESHFPFPLLFSVLWDPSQLNPLRPRGSLKPAEANILLAVRF